MNTLDLSEHERDLLEAYARSGDLALVADEFGMDRGRLRRTLSYLCHFDTGNAAELVAAHDAAHAPDVAADPIVEQEPEPAEPEHEPIAASRPMTPTQAETVLAEYGAATCPPCNYIGPAGDHACPTTPVIVRILTPAGN